MDEEQRKMAQHLSYLAYRWQDESEYENFNDYVGSMRAKLPAGFVLEKMTKKPFECVYKDAKGKRRWMRVKGGAVVCGEFV